MYVYTQNIAYGYGKTISQKKDHKKKHDYELNLIKWVGFL